MNNAGNFIKNVTLEKRKEITDYIYKKFPDKLPIIVEYNHDFPKDKRLIKFKFLVPKKFLMLEFTSFLRNKMELDPSIGIFIFVDNTLVKQGDHITTIYDKYVKEDNFLYFTLNIENVYG